MLSVAKQSRLAYRFFGAGVVDGVFMPHQFAFGAAGPAEGADADEQIELFAANVDAGCKIFEAGIGSIALAFIDNAVSDIALKGLDVDKAEIDGTAVDVGEMKAVVDTGCLDISAAHAGFVDIVFGLIEAAEVVDDPDHKLERVIGLEVEALKTFHGEAGGVGLAKGVAGETFDLPPHFGGEGFGITALAAVAPEFRLQFSEGIR